jgi:hypothetical protein
MKKPNMAEELSVPPGSGIPVLGNRWAPDEADVLVVPSTVC